VAQTKAVPGRQSVAALAGALAASLGEMGNWIQPFKEKNWRISAQHLDLMEKSRRCICVAGRLFRKTVIRMPALNPP